LISDFAFEALFIVLNKYNSLGTFIASIKKEATKLKNIKEEIL